MRKTTSVSEWIIASASVSIWLHVGFGWLVVVLFMSGRVGDANAESSNPALLFPTKHEPKSTGLRHTYETEKIMGNRRSWSATNIRKWDSGRGGGGFTPLVSYAPFKSSMMKLTIVQSEMLELYTKFLVDFSNHQQWATAKLIFPTESSRLQFCPEFQEHLLRWASLQATCSNPKAVMEVSGESQKLHSNRNIRPNSFVALHFLRTFNLPGVARNLSNSTTSPNEASINGAIPAKFLINYRSSHPILILAGEMDKKEELVDQLHPEINSNYKWTLAMPINRSAVAIENVFGFSTSSTPLIYDLGMWTSTNGVHIPQSLSLGPWNFQKRLIRVTTVQGQPVVYLNKSDPKNLQSYGYLPDILDTLSIHLNFRYKILSPDDSKFGAMAENGSWDGMVGQLQRKEAELALMSFGVTASRVTAMDFSPPVEYSSTRLLIRRDWQNAEIKWNAFLKPFDWKIWISIPMTILVGVFTLNVIAAFNLLDTTPTHSAWILSCCFLMQGQNEHSSVSVLPYRLALGTFWILALVIYSSYTAVLTSFLAASNDNAPFHSLYEAVTNTHWKVGLVRGSSFQDRVKQSDQLDLRLFWKRIQEDDNSYVDGIQQGVDRVYSERYIFFTGEFIPIFLVKGNCSYTWLPGSYFPGFGAMGYPKNLPIAQVISQRVAQIRETGQMKRLFRKWWGTDSTCSAGDQAFVAMTLYETVTAFIILLIGISLSSTFLTLEIIFKHKFDHAPLNFPFDSSADTQTEIQERIDRVFNSSIKSKISDSNEKLSGTNQPSFYYNPIL